MENSKKPPFTNRGVSSEILSDFVALPNTLNVIIDFIQCTFKNMDVGQVLKFLGLAHLDYVEKKQGFFGYNYTYIFSEKIWIMFHVTNKEKGVHLYLTGRGCREFEQLIDWYDFFRNVYNRSNIKFTRIDIAIDDFTGKYFSIGDIKDNLYNDLTTSLFRKAFEENGIIIDGAIIDGETVYFGSRNSSIRVMFYDKLAERKQADYIVHPDVKSWVRTEIKLRHERANETVKNIVKYDFNVGIMASSILRKYIQFRKKKKGIKHKKDYPIIDWWLKFVDSAEKIKLSKKAEQSTLQQKRKYLFNQYAKTATDILLGDFEDKENMFIEFFSCLDVDSERLDRINDYRVANKKGLITIVKANQWLNKFKEDMEKIIINRVEPLEKDKEIEG